jgi:hypothetical protein
MTLLLTLMACSGEDIAEAVDLVESFPEAPEGGQQWLSPVLTIEPYTESMTCTVYTYEGPDVGVHSVASYQSDYGHHAVMLRTELDEDDYPDGENFDCTDADSVVMTNSAPIILSGSGITGSYSLPEGMAANFERGDRVLLQSHYVNSTENAIRVQDAVNLGYLPEDEVEIWASSFAHLLLDHPIPGGGVETTHSVACEWDDEVSLLFLSGHMHEQGDHIEIDMLRDGETTRLYELSEWLPEHRDDPPVNDYSADPFQVFPGDVFTTTCTWVNETDEELNFPNEMCVSFGMLYPQKTPVVCDGE